MGVILTSFYLFFSLSGIQSVYSFICMSLFLLGFFLLFFIVVINSLLWVGNTYLKILDFSQHFIADAPMKKKKSKNVVLLLEDFWSVKSPMEEGVEKRVKTDRMQ